MTALAALALLLASAAPGLDGGAFAAAPTVLESATAAEAVAGALAAPGARAEVGEVRQSSATIPGCRAGTWLSLRPVSCSGQAALRFSGTAPDGGPCQGFAWAPVRVLAQATVATRAVRSGEPLEGAVRTAEVEVRQGHRPLAALPAGAVAARPVAAGQPVEESSIRIGPEPGAAIAVRIRTGALTVEQSGRAIPCARGLACALLPSGRRVEGRLVDGRLLVELP